MCRQKLLASASCRYNAHVAGTQAQMRKLDDSALSLLMSMSWMASNKSHADACQGLVHVLPHPCDAANITIAMHMARLLVSQVVMKIWQYIKAHGLQNPKDKRKIIPDEVLGTILTAPVNMMSMNSQLNKHCFTKGNCVRDDCILLCCSWMAEHLCANRDHVVVMCN